MEDGDSVTEHLNAFNTLVSQPISVNITIAEEEVYYFVMFFARLLG